MLSISLQACAVSGTLPHFIFHVYIWFQFKFTVGICMQIVKGDFLRMYVTKHRCFKWCSCPEHFEKLNENDCQGCWVCWWDVPHQSLQGHSVVFARPDHSLQQRGTHRSETKWTNLLNYTLCFSAPDKHRLTRLTVGQITPPPTSLHMLSPEQQLCAQHHS